MQRMCQKLKLALFLLIVACSTSNLERYTEKSRGFDIPIAIKQQNPDDGLIRIHLADNSILDDDNDLAFLLAENDPFDNVVLIERPCSFSTFGCDNYYKDKGRYSIEIIDALKEAIRNIVIKNNYKQIEIIGYSEGALLGLLIAPDVGNVTSIKTVAGVLDLDDFTKYHNLPAYENSLNSKEIFNDLKGITQIHYIGDDDEITPLSLAKEYLKQYNNKDVMIVSIEKANHKDGLLEFLKTLDFAPK